nr:hypothetical protein [Candidatus Magasanikbacteria bacterium]
PLVHERNLKNGSLIRTMTHPHIYLLMNGVKQHIVSEEVFLKHTWKWSQVIIVGQAFIQHLIEGDPITS